MPGTTISTYLIQRLRELGARHVFGVPGDYVLGANISSFVRVAEAMESLGVI